MSAPVDVLMVMDTAAKAFEHIGAKREGIEQVREARAAVAELIEALDGCLEHMEHSTQQGRLAHLVGCAALARVGGVK